LVPVLHAMSRQGRTWASVLAIATLAGCGANPPSCTAPETLRLTKELIAEDLREEAEKDLRAFDTMGQSAIIGLVIAGTPGKLREGATREDLVGQSRAAVGDYVARLSVQVSDVVSNGSESKSGTTHCAGTISVQSPSGESFTQRSEYRTQVLADQKGRFLLTIQQYSKLQKKLLPDMAVWAATKAKAQLSGDVSVNEKGAAMAIPVAPTLTRNVTPESSAGNDPSGGARPESQVRSENPAKLPDFSTEAQAKPNPSFDCSKASTTAELLICANKDLADADAELAMLYRRAMNFAADAEAQSLRRTQAEWRRTVRDTCGDADCMLAAYKNRQEQLDRSFRETK
jgi:uncharacterized protein YecT (DUF1311 family)